MPSYPTGGRRRSTRTPDLTRLSDDLLLHDEAQTTANATGTTVAGIRPQFSGFPKAAAADAERAKGYHREITRRGLQPLRTAARVIAEGREETDPCEAGTVGCSIDHGRDTGEGCETW